MFTVSVCVHYILQGNRSEQERLLLLSTTLYVGNLSYYTTEEQIHELFSKCGDVKRIIMGLDKVRKTPCGFCFVEYPFYNKLHKFWYIHHVHEISVLLVSRHYFDTHFEIVVTNDYWNCVAPSEMKRKKQTKKNSEFVLDSRFIHWQILTVICTQLSVNNISLELENQNFIKFLK